VLTQEYLPGVPISELLRLVRAGRRSALPQLGIDADQVAANLILSVYIQMFRHSFFHADPHPGNLLAMSGNRVAFVDFGLTDVLTDARRNNQANFIAAAYAGDMGGIYRELRSALVASPTTDEEAFKERFLNLTGAWLKTRSASGRRSLGTRSPLAQYLVELMHAIRAHGFRLPSDLLAMYRALLTAETIASELSGTVDLIAVGRQFFASQQLDAVIANVSPQRVQAAAFDVLKLGLDGPGQLSRLLADIAEDRFVLRVNSRDSFEDRRLANVRARLLATAILAVATATFAGLALVSDRPAFAAAATAAFSLCLLGVIRFWRMLR
jgi:ubiquinone biosynthesis protein